jgi:hypothetical protein
VENLTGLILCPFRKDIVCPDEVCETSSISASTVVNVKTTTPVSHLHVSAASYSNNYINFIIIYMYFVLSMI